MYDVKTAKVGDTFRGVGSGRKGWTLHLREQAGVGLWNAEWVQEGKTSQYNKDISLRNFFDRGYIAEPTEQAREEPQVDIWSL